MTRQHLNADEDFAALFTTVRRSSWRWECQGYYAVDAAEVDAWLAGEPSSSSFEDEAWLDYIRGLRDRGIPFQRLRMLTNPVTDYLRWMLTAIDRNVEAGEDVRWIHEAAALDLGAAPAYDYYLFDDGTPHARVAIFEFDDDKHLLGVTVDDDPAVVAEHRRWRDKVWPHATPHAEMVTTRP